MILTFAADPADIIEARKVLRVSEEELDTVTMLGNATVEDIYDRYYFQSSQEIINFYREEITQ
jgi:hypothetical protein